MLDDMCKNRLENGTLPSGQGNRRTVGYDYGLLLYALKGRDGKPCLAVGTKFGVQLFGSNLKLIGQHRLAIPAAGFGGPGGKEHDRVFVVGTDGQVTVLVLQ